MDILTVETLLVFGAHINAVDSAGKTPLDLVQGPTGFHARQSRLDLEHSPTSLRSYQFQRSREARSQHNAVGGALATLCHSTLGSFTNFAVKSKEAQAMIDVLKMYGGERGEEVKEHKEAGERGDFPNHYQVRRVSPFQDMTLMEVKDGTTTPIKVRTSGPHDDWTTKVAKYSYDVSNFIERKMLNMGHRFDDHPEETMAVMYQLRELKMLRDAGSRMLFLDGGGMKGLVQIEILSQLEEQTGRQIIELFDWIVGTSTGGIIALALVHGEAILISFNCCTRS